MELKGTIKAILGVEVISQSFKKQSVVLTTKEQYPQDVLIEFHNDNIDPLRYLKKGHNVVIHINIRGREWVNPEGVPKYFNTVVGWKVGENREE